MTSSRRKPAAPRVKAYRCNTCGKSYTEKTKIGHANTFGHKSFTKTK